MVHDLTAIADAVSRRNVVRTAGAALGVAAASGAAASGTAASGATTGDRSRVGNGRGSGGPYVSAHRGYRDVFPQNTVAAVSGAARLGADRIEVDLEATSDGEIVVFHDARLDDLTDESGLVAETPSEEVLQAEVLGSGETIPTLAEVLSATRPPVTMNLEFKDRGPLSWEEFAKRALDAAYRYPGPFYASSFDHDAIRAVREVDPDVDVAPIFGSDTEENLAVARELDAEALNCSTGVLDRELVEIAHEEGRAVNVWTIDSWREAATPIELGVDGLIADYPEMAAFGTDGGVGPHRGR
ncbi:MULTISPECIES: glycerophosphodiester phosphodiesterase [Halorubrum]|uniref:Glycerophosphoryl diester phosphodiesterase n=1 Tax=Halorubrum hochstenium ATCC 700873 TaxID=1227481 RepID=M0FH62_9EURY|nr:MULTISPECIES: glycerophosphodiester phosphodiesterase [Halorubrum]ELZ58557.1 glycerophosphoryl diester phosphodiesterase [Halorubrum hochstenium ATCC 700873]